jgi:hypothetical protein
MTCSVCATPIDSSLQYASCAIEGTCLAHCSDFVGHCSPVPEQEREDAARALDLERQMRELDAFGDGWAGMDDGDGG